MTLFVLKEETTSKQQLYTNGVDYTKNIIHVTCQCPDRPLDNIGTAYPYSNTKQLLSEQHSSTLMCCKLIHNNSLTYREVK